MKKIGTDNRDFIRRIYLTALIPNVIAVLGGTINVFFDGILVGQKLGDAGLAAVNQSLPIYLVLCTIGSLFGSGASFLSSIAFGANDKEKGQRIFRATFLTSTAVGLIVCLLGLLFITPLSGFLASSTSSETMNYVRDYVSITLIGGIFKILLYIPFFYLRLEGKNNRSAAAMLAMTALNILLDYLFLFVFDLGIAGAASASVIATIVACVLGFIFLFTDHSNFRPGIAFYTAEDMKEIFRYGSPMALNNILSSFRILFLNMILHSTGIAGLIAVFAVVNNVSEFSICIQNGVSQTASAMTGIFHGERDSGSVKTLLRTQLWTGGIMAAVFALLVGVFSGGIGKLFGSAANCTLALICFAVSLLFAVVNSTMTYFYNTTGRIGMANVITVCRGCITVVFFALVFAPLGEWIWIFYPASELFTLLLVLFLGKILAHRNALTPFCLLDERFEKSGKSISFTTDCSNEKICGASDGIRDFCEENDFNAKKTMAISLAIEEMLTIIAQKSLNGEGTMDVRVLKSGEEAILRIRSGGARYNPIEEMSDDLDYMGVQMITKIASRTEYLSALGVNTLIIFL